jgi:hypothetical protein
MPLMASPVLFLLSVPSDVSHKVCEMYEAAVNYAPPLSMTDVKAESMDHHFDPSWRTFSIV